MKAGYRYLNVVLVLCLGILSQADAARMRSDEPIGAAIKNSVAEILTKPHINSVSIGVYLDQRSYIGHFGELNKGSDAPPNDTTIYEIGSSSKTFTGTLIAKAVVEGNLNVDDHVVNFLPNGYENLVVDTTPIKIRHLLTHTAGLPNVLPEQLNDVLKDFLNPDTPYRINEILKGYDQAAYLRDLKRLKINTRPGSEYAYSSAGTELLAYVIERLYKRDYEQVLEEFLFSLGMTSTKISLEENEKSLLAPGYHTHSTVAAPPMARLPWGASGNMKSTVPDMMRYLRFQLDHTNPVARQSHQRLYQSESGARKIAYQWNLSTDSYLGEILTHHGGVPSAQNIMMLAPDRNLGIFIVTNQSGSDTPEALNSTLQSLVAAIKAGAQ